MNKSEAIIEIMRNLESNYTKHSIVYETVIAALKKLSINEIHAINSLVIASKPSKNETENQTTSEATLDRVAELEKKVDYLCNYILDDPDEIFSDQSGA